MAATSTTKAKPRQVDPNLPEYPKLFANANNPPVLVYQPDQIEQLGAAYKEIDLSKWKRDVPSVWLEPDTAAEAALAGSNSFGVTITEPGKTGTWTAELDGGAASWLSIDSPTTPQSVDGDVTYSFTTNTGPERVGKIYVNGKTFTVTQAGV